MEQNKDFFENASISKSIAKMAIPSIISMLVIVIYNMVDTFFVGQTGDANQVAAVSLAMPVFLTFMAIGNMFGIGGSAFISRLLGEKQAIKAKHVSSFCFYSSIIIGFVMMLLFSTTMPSILKLIGASENTAKFASDYLLIVGLGAPVVILSTAFSNIVRSEGASKEAMLGMLFGTIINIILDPIFILVLELGVKGAAIATVIGNAFTLIYFLNYLIRKSEILSISPKYFSFEKSIVIGVFSIGIPASLNNILMSFSNIVLNNFLASYGDIPVAAMGIAMKANMPVILLQIGLAMGVQPLIAYSYGAKNFDRMKSIIKQSTLYTIVLGSLITLIYWVNIDRIISAFIDNPDVLTYGTPMLKAIMLSGPIVGILFIVTSVLQAMGKPLPSLVLSVSRQGLIFIPALFIMNRTVGLQGIIYAQPIADYFSIAIAVIIYSRVIKKYALPSEKESALEF